MQPPQRGEPARRNRVAERVGRAAERAAPPDRDRPAAATLRRASSGRPARRRASARRAQRRREHLRGFGAAAALERRAGARQQRLQRRRGHAAEYKRTRIGTGSGERGSERTALACQTRLEARGAVAVAARPRLGAVQIAAAAARVRVLHFVEREDSLPSTPALRQAASRSSRPRPTARGRRRAARRGHVAEVLVAGDRAAPSDPSSIASSSACFLSGLHSRRDQIAHQSGRQLPSRRLDQTVGFGRSPRAGGIGRERHRLSSAQRSRIGITQRHAASTASRRMNSVGSPAITSSSSRS